MQHKELDSLTLKILASNLILYDGQTKYFRQVHRKVDRFKKAQLRTWKLKDGLFHFVSERISYTIGMKGTSALYPPVQ